MKVLLINSSDAGGGAAIAAVRLLNALNENGVYARLGVLKKKSSSPYVFELPQKRKLIKNSKLEKILKILSDKIYNIILNCVFKTTNGIKHTTNFHSETDINWINGSDFDIVNLHWISGVVCNKDIAKIKKPIVWTMHDSWPCCGAEHHPNVAEDDKRWKEGYYRKNKPVTTKGIDLCRKVWNQKKRYLSNKNIVFITPSRWEREVLKTSALFGHCKCEVIPNIVEHNVFYPRNRKDARKLLGIPADKTVIGFGAAYDIDNPKSMKGSYYLIEALQKLQNTKKYYLVIFGPASDAFTSRVHIPLFASGYISHPAILATIYSVCDVFVNPSLIENLPTTCLESICCGVPVVAFNVGGTSDIVVHKETGWLATPYKSEELAEGVEWCEKNKRKLSKNCLEKSKICFDEVETIKKYITVFSDLLKNDI